MSVLAMPSSRPLPDSESRTALNLAVSLSARLALAGHDDLAVAIADALDKVSTGLRVDACYLVEFSESREVAGVHSSKAALDATRPNEASALDPRHAEALARGQTVSAARRGTTAALLGVPASIGGQVVSALVVESARTATTWPQPALEELQILSVVLGGALWRLRQESRLRANMAMVEQLNARLEADNGYLKEEIKAHHDFDDIVGESAPLRLALARLSQVAPTSSTVLIQGQTGTGKELFARALHARSRRHARPLVRVNCAALPPTLVESELFGHEKGAFTGAVGTRQGRFELADGGTIFLDEIGDLTADIQVKFLRVLQEGEFERVGSSHTRHVDVRVIAATHRDLEAAVAAGTFRADLYYRLSVYPIRVPSLAERLDDIPRLVWFFINRHQRDLGRRITKVPQSVMDAMQRHSWPGNVRELENVVERAMIASTGDVLQLDAPLIGSTRVSPAGAAAMSDELACVQRAHIEAVLERCGWRINGKGNAAERLDVHPNTLRFRMKKLGVASPNDRARHDVSSS